MRPPAAGDPPTGSAAESATRGSRRAAVLGSLGVALAAVLVLGALAEPFDPSRLHVDGQGGRLNDRAHYVTTGRTLAATGRIESHVLLPAHGADPRSRLYMPGHYVALAASYLAFGYGTFPSLLPSLASFVVAAVCVFLVGRRLYGLTEGLLAALVFLALPANVTYAFTAMAELTFLAACLVAFCVFVHLPERPRPIATPLLLALPFLFRESGALVVLAATLAAAALRRGRDPFLVGAGLMGAIDLALVLTLYDVVGYKGVRMTMFVVPFCLVALAGAAEPERWIRRVRTPLRPWVRAAVLVAVAAPLLPWSYRTSVRAGLVRRAAFHDSHDRKHLVFQRP